MSVPYFAPTQHGAGAAAQSPSGGSAVNSAAVAAATAAYFAAYQQYAARAAGWHAGVGASAPLSPQQPFSPVGLGGHGHASFSPFNMFQAPTPTPFVESSAAAAAAAAAQAHQRQAADLAAAASAAAAAEQPSAHDQSAPKKKRKRQREQTVEYDDDDDDDDGDENSDEPTNNRKCSHVSKACAACRKSHTCCDNMRPCKRCIRMGVACEDPADTGKKRGGARPRKKQATAAPAAPAPAPPPAKISPTAAPAESTAASCSLDSLCGLPQLSACPSLSSFLSSSRSPHSSSGESASTPSDDGCQPTPRCVEPLRQQQQQPQPSMMMHDVEAGHPCCGDIPGGFPCYTEAEIGALLQGDDEASKLLLSGGTASTDPRTEEIRRLKVELHASVMRIRALERRIESNGKLEQDFLTNGQSGDTPVLVAGHFGRIIMVNEALRAKMGLAQHQFLDRPLTWDTLIEPRYVPRVYMTIRRMIESQERHGGFHVPVRTFDGRHYMCYLEVYITYDPHIKLPFVVRCNLYFDDKPEVSTTSGGAGSGSGSSSSSIFSTVSSSSSCPSSYGMSCTPQPL